MHLKKGANIKKRSSWFEDTKERDYSRPGQPLRQVCKMQEKSVQLCKKLKFCGNNVAIFGNMTI